MLRELKPKTPRAARALAKRAPQLVENAKVTLFLRSTTTSSLINSLVTDIYSLKRPLVKRFTKKNTVHPFEDPSSIEFFSQKNDTSLICFSSHSKKRPHCVTFIRCFDGKVLDMLECLVDPLAARSLNQFSGQECRVGTKPLISFCGSQFEDVDANSKFMIARSLFLDLFRGEVTEEIDVGGLQMLITFTATQEEKEDSLKHDIIKMRVWRIISRRSGQRLPRLELEEMGPRVDFKLGRIREPDPFLLKTALKAGRKSEARPKKNVETDLIGDKVGRIHLGRQDLQELQSRKMKGLKRSMEDSDLDNESDEEHDSRALDVEGETSTRAEAMVDRQESDHADFTSVGTQVADIKAKRARLR